MPSSAKSKPQSEPLMDRDTSAACQMFLIPNTILFAGLGTGPTEPLKVAICAMGLLSAAVWVYVVGKWKTGRKIDLTVATFLSRLFALAWAALLVVHIIRLYSTWQGIAAYLTK